MAADINTVRDFDRIRNGELFHPLAGARSSADFDKRAFAWGPAGEGVLAAGPITTKQKSVPCARASVWALRGGDCFCAYGSIARCRAQCTMWWRLGNGSWRTARYVNDRSQSCGADPDGPPPSGASSAKTGRACSRARRRSSRRWPSSRTRSERGRVG